MKKIVSKELRKSIVKMFALAMAVIIPLVPVSAQAGTVDLSKFSLQQPNGSTISASSLTSGYSSAWFYSTSEGKAFMCPQYGSTTSGSQHTRSELRENNTWSWSGTNTLGGTCKITKQNGSCLTVAQVFNSTDSIPLCELMFTKNTNSAGGNLQLLYEEAKGEGKNIYLSKTVSLGQKFSYKLQLIDGKLQVTISDQVVYTKTPSYSGKKFYFKAGNYDQSSSSGTVSTTPYSIVEYSNLYISHP